MDRVAWQATVHRVARVGHDLVTKERESPLTHPVLPKRERREKNKTKQNKKNKKKQTKKPEGLL